MSEEWRDVPGYEGKYKVSSLGRVRSFLSGGKIMSPAPGLNGYYRLNLCNNGSIHCVYLHRLVASVFIPNPDNLPEINHKDEDRSNNSVVNLEWCTAKYNRNYGSRNKRISDTLKRNAERRKNAQEY